MRDWDLNDVSRLRECWRRLGPPVHVAVAAYLGLNRPPPRAQTPDEILAFLQDR